MKPAKTQHVRTGAHTHRQYVDQHASSTATLASIKPAILAFFHLSEDAGQPAGKVYTFSHAGTPLTDQSVTLGSLAEGGHELKLDLVEQFEQG